MVHPLFFYERNIQMERIKGIAGKSLPGRLINSTLGFLDSSKYELFDIEHPTDEDMKKEENKAEKIHPLYDEREKYRKEKEAEKSDKASEKPSGIMDYLNRFKTNSNPNEDVLYKQNKDIPQSEIDKASKHSWFDTKDKDLSQRLSNKVSSWYGEVYGDGGAEKDATGRLMNPIAKLKLPEAETSLKTKDGLALEEGYKSVADFLSKRDISKTEPASTFALQKGLNSFSYQPELKEDGDIGPKTTSRLKQALSEQGLSSLLKKLG